MAAVIAEVLFNDRPLMTFEGENAEDRAWEFVMRQEILGNPRASMYDVAVSEVEYGA